MTVLFHLPPNLAAAAQRDAVPVKVEFDGNGTPEPAILPVLALLQRWCETPTPPAFLQLKRRQLRELAAAAGSQEIFFEKGRRTAWMNPVDLTDPAIPETPARQPVVQPRSRRKVAAEPMGVDGSEHFLSVSLPSKEHPAYSEVLDLVKSSGFLLEPSNRRWWLRDRHKTLSFLAAHRKRISDVFGATFTPNFERNTQKIMDAEIVCEMTGAADTLDVTVGFRAGKAEEGALRDALLGSRSYVESEGQIYLIDPAMKEKLAQTQRALAQDCESAPSARRMQRVRAERAVEVEELLQELAPGFRPPEEWAAKTDPLRNLSKLQPAPVAEPLGSCLRAYQRLGTAWMWHLHQSGLGGILADEMGLGKTLEALGLLSAIRGGPSLVVCPASLIENWRREAARFAPSLRCFVHHGERRLNPNEALAWDLVITSYGTLTRDRDLFGSLEFECVVGDEAQHIKNRRSQNAQALRLLRSKSRFLLTGTPVENSLDDLRSLFEFLLPGYLERVPAGIRSDERAWFDQRLRAKTAPYILRRTKGSVAPELPSKLEQIVWCEMSGSQAALYRSVQEKSERELFDMEASGAGDGRIRMAALTQLLRLRQICCDPRLVEPESKAAGSAKLDALLELLSEAVDDGHRVLVFSQFTSLLGLLRPELEAEGLEHCYLDGSMSVPARQAEVDRFQSSEVPVFLLSLKAGGTGLNLTAADTVIHFDPWWNPAVEAQATDRVHRIGQTRAVTSYKLVCSATVEEKVLALQDEKRSLLADVLEASDAAAAKLSLTDLKSLLAS